MNDAPPTRRSSWRFSIREMLLLMLAIAAFLGWGRAIYQRYKPFVPTPFASKLDLHADLRAIRKELGVEPGNWGSSSARGGSSGGSGSYERDYRFGFPFKTANGAVFVDKLQQRMRDQLDAHGCRIYGSGRRRSGDLEEFHLQYARDVVEGSLRAILVPSGDKASLLVFVEERRNSP